MMRNFPCDIYMTVAEINFGLVCLYVACVLKCFYICVCVFYRPQKGSDGAVAR